MSPCVATIPVAMRGLVRVLAVSIAVLVVLLVFAVHVLVPAVVSAAVRSSAAFAGQTVDVQVRSSLAGVLVHGWIDEVTIDAANVRASSMSVDRLQVTATDVGITSRTFASLEGTLSGVTATTFGGTTVPLDSVALQGSGGTATVVGLVGPAGLEAALTAELGLLGIGPAEVHLVNGAIQVDLGGRVDVATLRLDGSSLVVDPGHGQAAIRLLQSPATGAWRLTQAVVSAAGARITATIDLAALGLAG